MLAGIPRFNSLTLISLTLEAMVSLTFNKFKNGYVILKTKIYQINF